MGLCANEDILCSIVRCEVVENEVVGGELVLNVISQPAVWDAVDVGSEERYIFNPAGMEIDPPKSDDHNRPRPFVMPDAIEPVPEMRGDVHLVLFKLVQAGDFVLHGLVLVPSQRRGSNAECVDPVLHHVGLV